MTISTRQTFAAVSAAALVVLALAGCAGGQSKADACKALESTMTSVTSDLNSSVGDFATDPSAAVKKMQSVDDALNKGLDKVSNADVKTAGAKAEKSLAAFVAAAQKFSDDPTDSDALQKASTNVETDFTAIGKVCD
jgi:hypothetical protein